MQGKGIVIRIVFRFEDIQEVNITLRSIIASRNRAKKPELNETKPFLQIRVLTSERCKHILLY